MAKGNEITECAESPDERRFPVARRRRRGAECHYGPSLAHRRDRWTRRGASADDTTTPLDAAIRRARRPLRRGHQSMSTRSGEFHYSLFLLLYTSALSYKRQSKASPVRSMDSSRYRACLNASKEMSNKKNADVNNLSTVAGKKMCWIVKIHFIQRSSLNRISLYLWMKTLIESSILYALF